jgi:hypothetical protein
MKGDPIPRRRAAAFSLPEVTMSLGIVATVALPVLAMLAGGSSMQGTARDRETAARLAREAGAAIVAAPEGGGRFWQPAPELSLPLGAGGGEGTIHAAFDAEGRFLAEIDEGGWSGGESLGGTAVHLVRLKVSASAASPGGAALSELEICVEHPAAAAEASRSRERFLSRLAPP